MLNSVIKRFIRSILLLSILYTNFLTTAQTSNTSQCTFKYGQRYGSQEPLIIPDINSCYQTPHHIDGSLKQLVLRQALHSSSHNVTLPILQFTPSNTHSLLNILLTGPKATYELNLPSWEIMDQNKTETPTFQVKIELIHYDKGLYSEKYELSIRLQDTNPLANTTKGLIIKRCISGLMTASSDSMKLEIVVLGGSTWEVVPNNASCCLSTSTRFWNASDDTENHSNSYFQDCHCTTVIVVLVAILGSIVIIVLLTFLYYLVFRHYSLQAPQRKTDYPGVKFSSTGFGVNSSLSSGGGVDFNSSGCGVDFNSSGCGVEMSNTDQRKKNVVENVYEY